MEKSDSQELDSIILNEIQLILAEKRTSLSVMRTGFAVFALPLSVLSFLIATSNYYTFSRVASLLLPVLVLCGFLTVLGFYLVFRAIVRIRHFERVINGMKKKHSGLAQLME